MFVATVIVSALLAALLVFSAGLKFSHREQIVQGYARVGVPEGRLNYLAVVLLAGAAGLIVGLVWTPIGIAAAIGVICYFIGAVGFHIRAHDTKNLPTPVVFAVLATAALVLRIATA
ncbi:MAG: DoxX family protein [Pseudonocardiaceae bacterium]|nr:DoxX family protein [Pseudonocardiaceae bacterium]